MSKEVVDYDIVEHSNRETLVQLVKGYIGRGWQPHGGVAIVARDNGWITEYAQAMVKYKEEPR